LLQLELDRAKAQEKRDERMCEALDSISKQGGETKPTKGGEWGNPSKTDQQVVYLTRFCDRHSVTFCETELGIVLAKSLFQTWQHDLASWISAKMFIFLTVKLAMASCAGWWGGAGGYTEIPAWHLTIPDFKQHDEDEMIDYVLPTDNKVGGRASACATLDEWKKRAKLWARWFAFIYGAV